MTSATSADAASRPRRPLDALAANHWLRFSLWVLIAALVIARFCYLTADFPNESPWLVDQAKFTDEGWWANAVVGNLLTGHWFLPGDYNPAVALPVWPLLLALVFHFTGISIVAARALNVFISIATLPVVFLLVRRFTGAVRLANLSTESPRFEGAGLQPGHQTAKNDEGFSPRGQLSSQSQISAPFTAELSPLLAVLLLAASPFAFAFSRLAILDTLVVFDFCLLILLASCASPKRLALWVALAILSAIMVLTKTTAVLLLPAVFWIAFCAAGRSLPVLGRAFIFVAALPAAIVKGYEVLVTTLGYGPDFHYFFDANGMPDVDWRNTLSTLSDLFQNLFWVDRVLYPIGLILLILALVWKRKLWANPLFTASWIALAIQAAFIFRRQDNYAPRYFLVMLVPLICVAVLSFAEFRRAQPKLAAVLALGMMAAFVANVAMIGHFLTHRDYDLRDAARSIAQIVRAHPEQKQLLMGVSGNQLSLMTGIPSINDGFGTRTPAERVAMYQPGWLVSWNDTPPNPEAFANRTLQKMASYPIFDDEDRTTLILYEIDPRAAGFTEPTGVTLPPPAN